MKKEKLFCVLDTETGGTLAHPMVYDLGYVVFDKRGKVYTKRSVVISDIFFEKDSFNLSKMVKESYYCNKLPMYQNGILHGRWGLRTFQQARNELVSVLKKYNIKEIWCYNAGFDKRALKSTSAFLNCEYDFIDEIVFKDIWHCATELICNNRNFCEWAYANEFHTEKGNVKTSAEIVYRYLTKELDFVESHTALDDCLIEKEIFLACKRKKKKMYCQCGSHWHIPQKKYKKVKNKKNKD